MGFHSAEDTGRLESRSLSVKVFEEGSDVEGKGTQR